MIGADSAGQSGANFVMDTKFGIMGEMKINYGEGNRLDHRSACRRYLTLSTRVDLDVLELDLVLFTEF
jgi:hypothetical protein